MLNVITQNFNVESSYVQNQEYFTLVGFFFEDQPLNFNFGLGAFMISYKIPARYILTCIF